MFESICLHLHLFSLNVFIIAHLLGLVLQGYQLLGQVFYSPLVLLVLTLLFSNMLSLILQLLGLVFYLCIEFAYLILKLKLELSLHLQLRLQSSQVYPKVRFGRTLY